MFPSTIHVDCRAADAGSEMGMPLFAGNPWRINAMYSRRSLSSTNHTGCLAWRHPAAVSLHLWLQLRQPETVGDLRSRLFDVITKQHILIAQIQLAVGDDGMRPGLGFAALGLTEPAQLDVLPRIGFD